MTDYNRFLAARTKQEWIKQFPEIIDISDDMSRETKTSFSFCMFATLEILKHKIFDTHELDVLKALALKYLENFPRK